MPLDLRRRGRAGPGLAAGAADSRSTACASATASASCRWKAGTAPRDGEPERPDAPALAALRDQRREVDLGRRSGRGPARRPRESESAAADAATQRGDRGAARRAGRRASRALRRRTPTRDLYIGLQLTHSGRYARPNVYDRPEPLAAYAHPMLDRRFPDGVRVVDRRRARSPGRRLRRGGARSRGTPASRSSTSSSATAISATSCSARATAAGPLRRLAREPHALPAVGDRRRSARGAQDWRSPCACRRSTRCRIARRSGDGVGENRSPAPRRLSLRRSACSGRRLRRARSTMRAKCSHCCEELGVRWICDHRGQSVLQPARAAAGAVSAERRLRAARGSAARRRAADRGDGAAQGGVSATGVRRLGLQLPAGLAAARRAAHRAQGADRLRRPRPHGAVVSGTAGRRARGPPLQRKQICRTFSDCTTGPRLGLVSGCYPLDQFYKSHPHAVRLKELKKA